MDINYGSDLTVKKRLSNASQCVELSKIVFISAYIFKGISGFTS